VLTVGISGQATRLADETNTAQAMGSGDLLVFSTPSMVALMEEAAVRSVAPYLDEGQSTVGTAIDVRHTAATPVGMTVTCESRLTGVDGRRLTFAIRAYDEKGEVGSAAHVRAIVDAARFQAKADAKRG